MAHNIAGQPVKLLRVLVIAPEAPGFPKLEWADEWSGLANLEGVEFRLLGGTHATLDDISRYLRVQADVVVWSGHGGPNALFAVDGTIDGEWLAAQMGYCKPATVIVAACESSDQDSQGDTVVDAISSAGIDVVGFRQTVPDRGAIRFTREFIRQLAAGAMLTRAKDIAARMTLREFPGAQIDLLYGLRNGTQEMVSRMKGVEARLTNVESKLDLVVSLVQTLVPGKPARK